MNLSAVMAHAGKYHKCEWVVVLFSRQILKIHKMKMFGMIASWLKCMMKWSTKHMLVFRFILRLNFRTMYREREYFCNFMLIERWNGTFKVCFMQAFCANTNFSTNKSWWFQDYLGAERASGTKKKKKCRKTSKIKVRFFHCDYFLT